MDKYICTLCGYEYAEEAGLSEEGIEPGTKWEDVPEDFVCPACGAPKDMFVKS
ncbi:MAG: rubredoxin [Oscillospiraceae bacterium]|nr:rubredoxin [Oscillospiraceae bacterium]